MNTLQISAELTDAELASLNKRRGAATAADFGALLVQEKAQQWAQEDADEYARVLYSRIQAAPSAVQQAIFAAAEQALTP